MEKNFKRTTVTAALPYANGGVHIGHLAGVYVPADTYVRYLRLKKKDVVFIANLAPRKMMGIESCGMILSALDFDGSLAVTSLLRGVKPGSQVG